MVSSRSNQTVVRELFEELAEILSRQSSPSRDGAETICVLDDEGANYLVVRYGWHDGRRVRAVSLFVRVRDERVLIEDDMTDWDIADRLIRRGVPIDQIVVAYQAADANTPEPVLV